MQAAGALGVWFVTVLQGAEGRSFTLRGMERTPFALMQQCRCGPVGGRSLLLTDSAAAAIVDQVDQASRSSRVAQVRRRAVDPATAGRSIPGRIRELPRNQSPSLREPTGAHFSQSSTMPATLCKAMYLSAVMKVPSSRGSCTSRSHPHFSHASDIHWGGSDPVVMPTSLQNLARRRDPWRWRSCATIPFAAACGELD